MLGSHLGVRKVDITLDLMLGLHSLNTAAISRLIDEEGVSWRFRRAVSTLSICRSSSSSSHHSSMTSGSAAEVFRRA